MNKLVLMILDYMSEGGEIEIYGTLSGTCEEVMQRLLKDGVIDKIKPLQPFSYGFEVEYSGPDVKILIIPEDQVLDYFFNVLKR